MPFEMQKDIMYFRLSEEDEEDKRESNSISSQRACVEQYLHDRPELGSNFEEIVDDGYSGTSLDRPGMRRLLAMIKRERSSFATYHVLQETIWKPAIILRSSFRPEEYASFLLTTASTARNWGKTPADSILRSATLSTKCTAMIFPARSKALWT